VSILERQQRATLRVLQRSLKNGNLWVAKAVARDMPHVPLEDAPKLAHARTPLLSSRACLPDPYEGMGLSVPPPDGINFAITSKTITSVVPRLIAKCG